MATVTKDFRIKSGLVVEGATGTINGSDIITEDKVIGGTHSGISVNYDGNLNFNVNDPTITIAGDADGVATMTNLGDTTINVTLDTVNSNVGSFGGTTKIPTFTVNGKGLVTAASEVDVATNLSIAGDSGTDTVSLLTDTLTFEGGTGITSTISNNKVKVDIDSTVATLSDEQTLTNKVLGTNVDLGANLDAATHKIINLGTPTQATDAATKSYVDSVAAGLSWKPAVNLLATSNVPLTGNTETVIIDGHAALDDTDDGYRLLLIGQTTTTENGIYVYSDNGTTYTLARAADLDAVSELDGAAVFVMEGTQYGSTSWVQANHYADSFDDQEWDQFSGAGTYTAGVGLDLNGTEFVLDLSEVSTTSLPEGDNKYYTDERVDDRVAALVSGGTGITVDYDDNGNALGISAEFTEFDTSDVVEDPNGTGTSGTWYFTDQRAVAALEAVVPNFTEIEIDSIVKQVAAETECATVGTHTVYQFQHAEYRSAKFLVKVAHGSHTEISEVLLTLDTSNNVAITEYAVVGTNGSLGSVSASVAGSNVSLTVITTNNTSTVTVMGTLLA